MAAPFGFVEFEEDAGPEYDYLPEFQPIAPPPDSIMEQDRAQRRRELKAQMDAEREEQEAQFPTIPKGVAQPPTEQEAFRQAFNESAGMASPAQAMASVGKQLGAATADIGLSVMGYPGTENLEAAARQPLKAPLPSERELAGLESLQGSAAKGALSVPRTLPALAMGTALAPVISPYLSFPLAFGSQTFGETGEAEAAGKSAAVAALFPLVGRAMEPVVSGIGQQLIRSGVIQAGNETALKAVEGVAKQVAFQTLAQVTMLPEYIEASPEERVRMLAESTAANMVFAIPEALNIPKGSVSSDTTRSIAQSYQHSLQQTMGGGRERPLQMPASMQELAKQPTTGAPNAVQERQAAEVHGNVQEQPGQRAGNVPAEGGIEQVPQRGVPPRDTGGGAPAEEAGRREVSLNLGDGFRAEINPVTADASYYDSRGMRVGRLQTSESPEGWIVVENHSIDDVARGAGRGQQVIQQLSESTGKQIVSDQYPSAAARSMWERLGAKRERVKIGDEEQMRYVLRPKGREVSLAEERFQPAEKPEVVKLTTSRLKNPQGDPLGTTYRGTAEDYNRYQAIQKEFKELSTQGKDLGSPEMAAIFKEQETIKNKYGGMPPEPPRPAAEAIKGTESAVFDSKKFTTTNEAGESVADVTKLREAVDKGEVNGGVAANPLLSHLLKPSEAHPLKAIKLLDLSPEELAAITGRGVAYKGRFTLDRATPEGTIEILTRDANGNPLTHADFVQTLNHELTHNAVTSKIDQAPPELRKELDNLFDAASKAAKGTEFENHNALTDIHELLAEKGSSPRVQTWLAQQPMPGAKGPVTLKNSIWGHVLGIVKKVLGLPDKLGGKDTVSILDEAMRLSAELEGIKRETKGAPEERFAREEERKGLPMAPRAGEAGAISLAPLQALVTRAAPPVREALNAVRETAREATTAGRMTDYRRSVLNWSGKLQRSFQEAATAQRDIETRVPDKVRREGITNWIQADGDAAVLRQRAAASRDPKLRAGYEAALRLTPEELAVANEVRQRYSQFAQRGKAADVINNFKENYVTQIWNLKKGPGGTGSSRTLKERFRFSKASTFPTFFEGEQAGYVPKTKDISRLLPVYMHEMNSVIAARELVQQMSRGRASDGRPLVTTRGTGTVVSGAATPATLIRPKAVRGETNDYKVLANQPALQGWRWATEDPAGNPVFLKGDLALHPEAYNKLKNVLGRSAIREWYSTPTTRLAEIPKKIVHGIDLFNSETKRTMLGLLAPFHQVQTGTHAVGHRVNPFGNIPTIDLVNNRAQADATAHGLMLAPDRASESQFMEGFRTSGLVSKIPGLGKLSDLYSNYLFHQYIPGLKFKTYEAILRRNQGVYAADLASGRMRAEDIKALSAEQANAAYGHLNYADLARNPTVQHTMQLGLLAPDFLEARTRFAGQAAKGLAGGKAGREQTLALATLALTQMAAAYVSAQLSGGEWDKRHPFEFHIGSRKYTMRSVPEDISNLISNTRSFVHSRLSPIIGKGALQYLTGVDYAGRKVSAGETTKELLAQPIPITLRSLPGVREVSGANRPGAINWWEQLAGAVGLKIGRYYPNQEINRLYGEWLKNNKDPQVKADYERNQAATFPVSKYKALDAALTDRNQPAAIRAIQELKAQGQKNVEILERMRPVVGQGVNIRVKPLFHQSQKYEAAFRNSLTAEERQSYKAAIDERKENWREFLKAWRNRGSTPQAPFGFTPVPTNAPFGFVPSR